MKAWHKSVAQYITIAPQKILKISIISILKNKNKKNIGELTERRVETLITERIYEKKLLKLTFQ